jgi:hypothetical protein
VNALECNQELKGSEHEADDTCILCHGRINSLGHNFGQKYVGAFNFFLKFDDSCEI